MSANPENGAGRTAVLMDSITCSKCGQPATLINGQCRNCNLTEPIKMTAREPFPKKVYAILAIGIGIALVGFAYVGWWI